MPCELRLLSDFDPDLLAGAVGLGYDRVAVERRIDLDESVSVPPASRPSPSVLTRLTVAFSEPSGVRAALASPAARSYDLIVAEPRTDAAFKHACVSVDADLVRVDPEGESFRPDRRTARCATRRGLRFELSYASALSGGEPRARFVRRVLLFRSLAGPGAVSLSSGARNLHQLRSRDDVAALEDSLGLGERHPRRRRDPSERTLLAADRRRRGRVAAYAGSER